MDKFDQIYQLHHIFSGKLLAPIAKDGTPIGPAKAFACGLLPVRRIG